MRGQSPIFEQVMLFTVGIAIFIICFSMFKIYENYFSDMAINDQLNEVRDFITSNILRLSKSDRETNSSIVLKTPRTIANKPYYISLSSNGINVTMGNVYSDSGLYGLAGSFELGGNVTSSYGKYVIYKKGNKIIIG